MPRRDRSRPDHQRATLAEEAARIMQEHGLTDFRSAKDKAAERLGLGQLGSLPSNEEVATALARRNRIFRGDSHGDLLGSMRRSAAELMRVLEEHRPRLVGALLDETATEHSRIELHATNDAPEAVGATLELAGVVARYVQQRLRLRRDEVEAFPALRFVWQDHECLVTVFPEKARGHAPLSPVDGRPMRRASLAEVEALVAAG